MIIITAQQARCYYHPERAAVEKCERCNRMICLQDKMIDRVYWGMDRGDEIHVYCPVCYNEVTQARKKAGKIMSPICLIVFAGFCIIFVVMLIFVLTMMSNIASNMPTP